MKWICIKENISYKVGDIMEDKLRQFMIETYLIIKTIPNNTTDRENIINKYNYIGVDYWMPLAQYREKRIDEILNDE